jgi:hypothetical protein
MSKSFSLDPEKFYAERTAQRKASGITLADDIMKIIDSCRRINSDALAQIESMIESATFQQLRGVIDELSWIEPNPEVRADVSFLHLILHGDVDYAVLKTETAAKKQQVIDLCNQKLKAKTAALEREDDSHQPKRSRYL